MSGARTSGGGGAVRNVVTSSDCANLYGSVKMSHTLEMVLVILGSVILIVTLLYVHFQKSTATSQGTNAEKEAAKNKLVGIMYLVATIIVSLGAIASIWNSSASSNYSKACIGSNN